MTTCPVSSLNSIKLMSPPSSYTKGLTLADNISLIICKASESVSNIFKSSSGLGNSFKKSGSPESIKFSICFSTVFCKCVQGNSSCFVTEIKSAPKKTRWTPSIPNKFYASTETPSASDAYPRSTVYWVDPVIFTWNGENLRQEGLGVVAILILTQRSWCCANRSSLFVAVIYLNI